MTSSAVTAIRYVRAPARRASVRPDAPDSALGSAVRRAARWIRVTIWADLITGMAAFSVIVSTTLWWFSLSGTYLDGELTTQGRPIGTALQLYLADAAAILGLPIAGLVVFLAYEAYRIPRAAARPAPDPLRAPGLDSGS